MTINTAAVPGTAELSGIAYSHALGDGSHRFLAVQDSGGQLVSLSLTIASDGTISSAASTSTRSLAPSFDFEGIALAFSGNILVAEESTPHIRSYDETSGVPTGVFAMPAVFSDDRSNFAFESLTRSADGQTYWTANEAALNPDGPLASTTQGTTVRLQKFHYGKSVPLTLGAQYAYQVDPIHTGTSSGPEARSGLSDLVALPDGSLLALERSLGLVGGILPSYQARIYRVTFDGATDTSVAPFSSGLSGQSYVPATKTLLWSGQVGGSFGENMESLSLGPLLPNGSWSLIGVVDDGDQISTNTLVAFTLTPQLLGAYNFDGHVDAADYVVFRKGLSGDFGSHYSLWRTHFGESTAGGSQQAQTPEPTTVTVVLIASVILLVCPR
jgi:hypothetical protein